MSLQSISHIANIGKGADDVLRVGDAVKRTDTLATRLRYHKAYLSRDDMPRTASKRYGAALPTLIDDMVKG